MKTWQDCVAFHGHECGGLTIGYKASLYAIELLDLTFSDDEQVVCVAENDACGIDGIQVMLGCSVGKGNMLFRMRGKSAYSFFNRKTGKSVRLPEKARLFASYTCDCCGETAGSNWIRLAGDKKLCLDCYESYDRFDI